MAELEDVKPDVVDFPPGSRVRLKSDPGREGITTGKTRVLSGVVKYQVVFPEERSFKPSYELELLPEDDDAGDGAFGRVRDLRRLLTHIHLSGKLANLVYSMDATNTEYFAYQYKPVLSFLESPSKGLLIADEVGLGKTIEAGLIWTELRAREDARRLLIVCPSMLRSKWKAELGARFGIDAQIVDAKGLLDSIQDHRRMVPDGQALICSMQGIRPGANRETAEDRSRPTSKLAEYFESKSADEPLFDLVIVDEAHYMRNPMSQTAELGRLLREVTDALVLLSATPINLKNDDLFYLLNLVDPDSFSRKEDFPDVLNANQHLSAARDLVLNPNASAAKIAEELMLAKGHSLLRRSKQLEDLANMSAVAEACVSHAGRVRLANGLDKVNLLRHAVTRTRKSEVHEMRVIRVPQTHYVPLSADGPEIEFYQLVTETIRRYAEEHDISDGFLLASPQRQISSCMYAAALSWRNRYGVEEEELYEDFGGVETEEKDRSPMIDRLRKVVLPRVDIEALYRIDSKYAAFKRVVIDFIKENPNEKVIVFSYYRPTLAYLHQRLAEDGVSSIVLKGGMKIPKDEVIKQFKEDDQISVLLSSEVASEGVDLQFSRVLVNYDLPWNPMRVEQRIGRIDRIGQRAGKINVVNILLEGTIDHKIHNKLYERLKIFEHALGGMEAILGEEVRRLTADLLTKTLTQQEEQARIEQTALAIENTKLKEEELEKNASHLIAHGDYILEKVDAAQKFKKRITDLDLVAYVKDYLDKFCQGFEFTQLSAHEFRFDLQLPAKTAAELGEFIKENKLYGQTQLASGENIRCRFANKVRDLTVKEEVVSQFHPLVRFIGKQLKVKEIESPFYRQAAMRVSTGDRPLSGVYVYRCDRWSFNGIKVEEELPVRALCLETGALLEPEESWNLLNSARINGDDWLEVDNEIDRECVKQGLKKCEEALDQDFVQDRRQRENENQDRVTFQVETAKRHFERNLATKNDVLSRYRSTGNTRMIPAYEGQIKQLENRYRMLVEQLKLKSQLHSSQDEVCWGVIDVR